MGDHYGDESQSGSDQEELVGTTDIDDDLTDTEEMQYSFCKITGQSIDINNDITNSNTDLLATSLTNNNNSNNNHNNNNNNNNNANENSNNNKCCDTKSKLKFFGLIILLYLSTFLLLISFPLYFQQLNIGDIKNNVYGAILYCSSFISLIFIIIGMITSWMMKWNIKLYKCPIAWKRLLTISTCSGIAGTLCIICSYQRVPCHLQDPLKGATLAYSLVFYFFFCKKVMGLQRLFSATTAVVGLFISVDYGLCDGFRCRGIDLPTLPSAQLKQEHTTVGWQGRAIWTLVYIIGIGLWTLHLSLLEGHVVTFSNNIENIPKNNLLTTVSRIVSNSDTLLNNDYNNRQNVERTQKLKKKKKPYALHVAIWIHAIGFFIVVILGWIDLIPGTGNIESINEFWQTTGNTYLCHLNLQKNVPDNHDKTLEFLSNLTPGSLLYNKTVQKLRSRTKRDTINYNNNIDDEQLIKNNITLKNRTKIELTDEELSSIAPSSTLLSTAAATPTTSTKTTAATSTPIVNDTTESTSKHLTNNNNNKHNNKHTMKNKQNFYQINNITHTISSQASSSMIKNGHKKINSEKFWKKLKNSFKYTKHKMNNNNMNNIHNNNHNNNHNQTPVKVSRLILNTNSIIREECIQLRLYSLIFILAYILFAICLYNFLFVSESAVFTITVITSTLPIIGIFWSIFALTTKGNIAIIKWSPEITGELICSLLGTPIVLLGVGLLCRTHLYDKISISLPSRTLYTSLTSRDP